MRVTVEKKCSTCGAAFTCGPQGGTGQCWCEALPHVPPVCDVKQDCLCPACLRAAITRLHPEKEIQRPQ
jgi:hypothetical protein